MTSTDLGKLLLISAELGDIKKVRRLLMNGAKIIKDSLGSTALHHAAEQGHFETVKELLSYGVCCNPSNMVGKTPLHKAAEKGVNSIVKMIIDIGGDIEATDLLKMTPLHWAVQHNHTDCVTTLISRDACMYSKNKFDLTPMEIAIKCGFQNVLEIMILMEQTIREEKIEERMKKAKSIKEDSLIVTQAVNENSLS